MGVDFSTVRNLGNANLRAGIAAAVRRPVADSPGMSIAVRRRLAAELKRLRLATGKSQADVAASGIAVVETIRSIEKAERKIKTNYVKQLCELYGTDGATTARLMEMARNVQRGGWWESYRDFIAPEFRFYIQAEADADQVITYDSELPYGLLQTPEYHQAIFEADPVRDPKDLGREIEFRRERQRATLGRTPKPLRISSVLNEAVLVRQVGGRKVMKQFRDHLLMLAMTQEVDVRVLRWSCGAHAAMGGAFQVVVFDDPDSPDVGYLETYEGELYVEDQKRLQNYRLRHNRILSQSVSLEEYLR
jgi:transcriptional regulator with XRE-family HTH domain